MYLKIDKEPSITEQELTLKIFEIKSKHPNYGYRRVTMHLENEKISANHKKILRILRENNLLCPKRKPRKKIESWIKATYLTPKLGINLVNDIIVTKPYQVVRTDFTELITISGRYKLIVYLCQHTKVVLNWKLGYSEDKETAINCLKPILPLLNKDSYVHQDQGSAFISNDYVDLLLVNNIFISYSEVGTPTDNGDVESFFGRLKNEWSDQYYKAQNLRQLRQIIKKAINYYNNERIHTTIKAIPQYYLKRELYNQNLSIHRGA